MAPGVVSLLQPFGRVLGLHKFPCGVPTRVRDATDPRALTPLASGFVGGFGVAGGDNAPGQGRKDVGVATERKFLCAHVCLNQKVVGATQAAMWL